MSLFIGTSVFPANYFLGISVNIKSPIFYLLLGIITNMVIVTMTFVGGVRQVSVTNLLQKNFYSKNIKFCLPLGKIGTCYERISK